MTVHSFKNGIVIHIPDGLTDADLFERWTEAKVNMSILITPMPKVEVKERKPRSLPTEETKEKISKSLKTYFKKRKSWRSPKKPGLFLK